MIIRAGYSIAFDFAVPTPLLLKLHVCPERRPDLLAPEKLTISPEVSARTYHDRFDNVCTRLVAPAGIVSFTNDFLIQDSGKPEVYPVGAEQHPVDELPDEVLMYLTGSRYCDTERLVDIAWDLFGGVEPGWRRVKAILDYTHGRLSLGFGHAHDNRTASEAYIERVGVGRDFAHLAITLCRCMNIPARYCTGYLGDIGVPRDPAPMDFSAWFEVYLGSAWHALDARHLRPRIGRIVIARGLDAVDTAMSIAFGKAKLVRFQVFAEEEVAADVPLRSAARAR
jgi:transglutaminase-like putative cysteine protease